MRPEYRLLAKLKLHIVAVVALLVAAIPVRATTPLLLPTKAEVWESAKATKLPAVLQIGFRTDLFNRYQDILSSVIWELPSHFSSFGLDDVNWGLHTTLLSLDALSLEDAAKLVEFFNGLTEKTLQANDLLGEFTVFNPVSAETVLTGPERHTIAIKPHPAFVQWNIRFWALLKERAPDLYRRCFKDRAPTADDVTIAVLESPNDTSESDNETARRLLNELLLKKAQDFPPITFNPHTTPLQLVSGKPGSGLQPTNLMAFIVDADRRMAPSQVGSWVTWVTQKWKNSDRVSQIRTLIEFDNQKLAAADPTPFVPQTNAGNNWYRSPRYFDRLEEGTFQKLLTPNLAAAYSRELPQISVFNQPAQVGPDLFVLHKAYAKIDPARALPLIAPLRELQISSSNRVSKGLALYGSTTKSEIKNPADSDLLLNSLVHVPDTIDTLKDAEAYARKAFLEETLGHLITLAKQEKIAFSELRIGSDFTMGLDQNNPDIMARYENNPYLTQQDIFNGTYTDRNGRVWTLEELVALGDFMKAKIDLFVDGSSKRLPISLQFFLGFEWKGHPHFLRRNGLKGAHSTLMETGVYFGAESFGIAATLDRTISYYVTQRGQSAARAIGELLSIAFPTTHVEPYWKSKFLKRFYSFLIVIRNRNGGGMDEIFFEETKRLLEREGKWDSHQSLLRVTQQLLMAVNRPEVNLIGKIKDTANDLAEFLDRGKTGQEFTQKQWEIRSNELREQLPQLNELILSGKLPNLGREFWTSFRRFSSVIDLARALPDPKAATRFLVGPNEERRTALRALYSDFKHRLEELDMTFNTDPKYGSPLAQSTRDIIATMTSLAPHFYSRYVKVRTHPSLRSLRLMYRLMGIQPTDGVFTLMNELDEKMDHLSRAEIARMQARIFSSGCEENLL